MQADPAQWKAALAKLVIFSLLAPFDAETSDVLANLAADKKLAQLPAYKTVLDQFRSNEVMPWPLTAEAEWKADDTFAGAQDDGAAETSTATAMDVEKAESKQKPATSSASASSAASTAAADLEKRGRHDAPTLLRNNTPTGRWRDLHKSVVQHNMRVISGYYERISSARLAGLLDLDAQRCEDYLSEMVSSKQLYAKIDRPTGIVSFVRPSEHAEPVNAWSSDIEQLLQEIEHTCHLINKVTMRACTHAHMLARSPPYRCKILFAC